MKHYSRSPPGSPGKPQSTLLGGVRRRPTSPFSPVSRTDTAAPARESRGGEPLRAGEAALAVLADRRSGDVAPEEWVKVSWKKGECRGEIKLVAEAAGLGFEAAQIVVRLDDINHECYMPTSVLASQTQNAERVRTVRSARRYLCETRTWGLFALCCLRFPGCAEVSSLSRGAKIEPYRLESCVAIRRQVAHHL